jgi:hypothetical protein
LITSSRKGSFARVDEDPKPGDEVIMKDGPHRAFAKIFKGRWKALIEYQTVTYQSHVEIGDMANFCGNLLTKEMDAPMGFLDHNEKECEFFELAQRELLTFNAAIISKIT